MEITSNWRRSLTNDSVIEVDTCGVDIGDKVYFKNDDSGSQHIVIGFTVLPGGVLKYNLSGGNGMYISVFDIEITKEKPILIL